MLQLIANAIDYFIDLITLGQYGLDHEQENADQ